TENLLRAMRATVDLENVIVEVLDAEAQARDTHFADRTELVIRQCAGLGLERDLARVVPRQQPLHAVRQKAKLVGRKITGRAATEVDEPRLAAGDGRLRGIDRQFLQQRVEIPANLRRILVRVDFVVTKVAALPAKRNVGVEAERS